MLGGYISDIKTTILHLFPWKNGHQFQYALFENEKQDFLLYSWLLYYYTKELANWKKNIQAQ